MPPFLPLRTLLVAVQVVSFLTPEQEPEEFFMSEQEKLPPMERIKVGSYNEGEGISPGILEACLYGHNAHS